MERYIDDSLVDWYSRIGAREDGIIDLYYPLTHKYRAGWKSSEHTAFLGVASVYIGEYYYDEEGGFHITVIVEPLFEDDPYFIISAIKHHFRRGCTHEHDCCGCLFNESGGCVTAVTSKMFKVEIVYSPNI